MARTEVEGGGVVAAARRGDESAFSSLVERYRPELQLHCYRMLGSLEDSEDVVQETFLRAWRNRQTFEGRSSFRTWLYRIATNACLDALQRRPRVPSRREGAQPLAEVPWLQPYPDRLLEEIPAGDDEPHVEVVAKETIELAFIAAIQLLPPRQRAVLIARDVLGWSAAESTTLLGSSVASVNSALQRARATMKQHLPRRRVDWSPDEPSPEERALLERYIEATDKGDPAAIVKLLREDAFCAMPPSPQWWIGRDSIVEAWVKGGFGDDSWGHLRCLITGGANRQPAVACYVKRAGDTEYRPLALDVLRIEGDAVAEITAFPLEPLLDALGLPRTV
ncbi:MAG TPA: RNA polymerase subunit sigma-70 [Gaiellaceae bacterium]|nr:RNA polymerase subunit sigma-70 [Gaiellaceae bacterium]